MTVSHMQPNRMRIIFLTNQGRASIEIDAEKGMAVFRDVSKVYSEEKGKVDP